MQMRPDIQLQSVLKAMSDVILPAIDPGNQLAQEQARLCMGLLSLLRERLPLQFAYDCEELRRLADSAQALAGQPALAAQDGTQALSAARADALQVLDRAQAGPAEVTQAVRALRAHMGALVQHAGEVLPAEALAEVQAEVLRCSRAQLVRERAWFLPQGWESRPDAIPPLSRLLGLDEAARASAAGAA